MLLLWLILTVPTPDEIDRNSGAGEVAVVLLVIVAVVLACVYRIPDGSDHSTVAVLPLKLVPVNVTGFAGHASFGSAVFSVHADAAWALPRNTSRPTIETARLKRLANRARGSALVPCMASLR